ncbi:ribulose-phosphate 3-epimerase [Gilvimarinus polysaccharolyticus]|uniref:ribulose-phosphate 3-epimerase n=1 Tax=Gilvimarinus polysaccharolyticus TaxID=863921 RepID=UPI0006733919|nr:ribulose-phosphate 3-epimerase [Gilvimarinus polysaccharolyticus]
MAKQSPIIAPSILSADFARLGDEASQVLSAGGDWLHLDVMDHQFVPNMTVGPLVCQALRNYGINAPIDVHLMVAQAEPLIEDFAKAGATRISFHPESVKHLDRSINRVKELGCQVGLVLNPATPLTCVSEVLAELDMLLLMSVNPGFGGQAFIAYVMDKIRRARQMIDACGNADLRLQVDGGVKVNNIAQIAAAGADTFVVGSEIFNAENYADIIDQLRCAIAASVNNG